MERLMCISEELMRHVEVIQDLGEGVFGLVSLVTYKGVKCCLKIGAEGEYGFFMEEAQTMYDINGAGGAPKVMAISQDGSAFLMEYVEGMNLFDFACQYGFSIDELKEMFANDIKDKVEELHNAGYMHCDLHCRNVMVCGSPGNYHVRLIDFGRAEKLEDDYDDDVDTIDSEFWFALEDYRRATKDL